MRLPALATRWSASRRPRDREGGAARAAEGKTALGVFQFTGWFLRRFVFAFCPSSDLSAGGTGARNDVEKPPVCRSHYCP